MHSNTVLCKTAKGQEEVATRQHGLSIRLRALLIPVNGEKPVGEIIRTHPAGQQAVEMMQGLLEQGFVEVVGNQPAIAAAKPASKRLVEAVPAPAVVDAVRLSLVKRYLIEFVDNTLGFMGGDIITRIQATDDPAELADIAHSCAEVVSAVAGAGKAKAFQVEVDKLMGT